jgi:hypothetical protein
MEQGVVGGIEGSPKRFEEPRGRRWSRPGEVAVMLRLKELGWAPSGLRRSRVSAGER